MRFFYPLVAAVILVASPAVFAQSGPGPRSSDLQTLLNFERGARSGIPSGWTGGPPGTLFADDTVVHAGKWAARLERGSQSPQRFSTLTATLPIDFAGNRVELRGFLRTEGVSGYAGLWLRVDGAQGPLAVENMQSRGLKGTTEWAEYTISVPLTPAGRRLHFGALVSGTGKAWADDLQLLVDGQPIWDAPAIATAMTRDKEFDTGSGIALSALTPVQIANLATTCQVWGLLKYHHPSVTRGELHWDYELFRILPGILAATDAAAAQEVLLRWIDRLGELPKATRNNLAPAAEVHLPADVSWVDDKTRIGEALAVRLRAVHASRSASGEQFYVGLAGAGNPEFEHEPAYPRINFPDAGYQLLGLFRFWNIIQYWFPYRNLIEDDWDAVLRDFVPRIALAKDADAYQLELIALIARVHDTHANLWSSLRVRPPQGEASVPATFRFIEGRATVTRVLSRSDGKTVPLQRGDVVHAVDGTPVDELVKAWTPYYPASNEPTRLRDIARALGRGAAGPARLKVQRGNETLEIEVHRVAASDLTTKPANTHDLPGSTFQLLSPDVAYLKLSSVKTEEIDGYVKGAAGTKGWIIDIRNYSSAFMVFALGGHFVDKPTEFARFTIGNPTTPGAFSFGRPLTLAPRTPRYTGKIVILVDEVSQSSSEYTAMAFRTAPGALVIGSTTAGADGNISRIPLPGGHHSVISGIGVFYPDKRPTQRIGIVPDIEVKPTLAGIRAGRDEVLARALQEILGPGADSAEIARLSALRD